MAVFLFIRVLGVFVIYFNDVTGIAVDVIVYFLTTIIGQIDVVVAFGVITFALFVLSEVDVAVFILDFVCEIVFSGSLLKKLEIEISF